MKYGPKWEILNRLNYTNTRWTETTLMSLWSTHGPLHLVSFFFFLFTHGKKYISGHGWRNADSSETRGIWRTRPVKGDDSHRNARVYLEWKHTRPSSILLFVSLPSRSAGVSIRVCTCKVNRKKVNAVTWNNQLFTKRCFYRCRDVKSVTMREIHRSPDNRLLLETFLLDVLHVLNFAFDAFRKWLNFPKDIEISRLWKWSKIVKDCQSNVKVSAIR